MIRNSFDAIEFQKFLESYTDHPLFKKIREKPWLRLALFSSSRFLERDPEKERANKNDCYYLRDLELTAEHLARPKQVCAALDKLSAGGVQIYWYTNLVPLGRQFEKGSRPAGKDISNCLYWRVDFDHTLPVGVTDLCRKLDLWPTMVITTSNIQGVRKLQLLFGVAAADSRKFEQWREVQGELCAAVGGDPAAVDLPRVFRLPGSINWKYDLEVNNDIRVSVSLPNKAAIEADSVPAADRRYYKLAAVRESVEGFTNTRYARLLQECAAQGKAPVSGHKRAVFARRDATRGEVGRLSVGYEEVLRTVRDTGKYIIRAGEGKRHNAFLSWTGELAWSVASGQIVVEKAREILLWLNNNAFSRGLDKAELQRLMAHFDELCSKDLQRLRAESDQVIQQFFSGDGKEGGGDGDGEETGLGDDAYIGDNNSHRGGAAADDRTGLGRGDGAAGKGKDARSSGRDDGGGFESELPGVVESWSSILASHDSRVESKQEWIAFLWQWLEVMNAFWDDDSITEDVFQVIFSRLEKFRIFAGLEVRLPMRRKTAWGETVWKMKAPDKDQFLTFIDSLLQKLNKRVVEHARELKGLRECRERVQKLKERVIEDNTDASGVVDYPGVKRELQRAIEKLLRVQFSDKRKRTLLTGLRLKLSLLERETQMYTDRLVFQNGTLVLGEAGGGAGAGAGRFLNAEAGRGIEDIYMRGWRDRQAVYGKFDIDLACAIGRVLPASGVGDGAGQALQSDIAPFYSAVKGLCRRYCPGFASFVESAFPADDGAMTIVLSMLGYAMLGGNPRHAIFIFYGAPGSGKGTLARLIQKLVGEDNVVSLDYENVARESEGLIHAVGKHVAILDESNRLDDSSKAQLVHARVWNKLKEATGGGRLRVRGIWVKAIESEIQSTPVLVMNRMPAFPDDGGAWRRRVTILHFAHVPEVPIAELENKILAGEASALATLGAMVLQRRWGLSALGPLKATSVAQSDGYAVMEESTSPLYAWLRKALVPSAGGCVTMEDMRAVIREWCEQNGVALPSSDRMLGMQIVNDLRYLGLRVESRKLSIRGERVSIRCVVGVELSEAARGLVDELISY